MNLHQFRFVQEAVRRGLNLTETAKALHTSQPGVSKAILELEEELGIDIFARHGKRLRRVTEPGEQVLKSIEIILREVGNLKRIGDEFSKQDAGRLSIATTHTQARYVLPEPVALLRRRYPKVNVSLHQGTPEQVAQMLLDESADMTVKMVVPTAGSRLGSAGVRGAIDITGQGRWARRTDRRPSRVRSMRGSGARTTVRPGCRRSCAGTRRA